MLQWQLVAPQQLKLTNNQPTKLTETLNAKVKLERILFSQGDYSQYCSKDTQHPKVLCRYGAGVVSEVLEGSMLTKMDRVLIEHYITCGNCSQCLADNPSLCESIIERGVNYDGLMSNFVDVNSRQLYKLPDSLSFDKALFVPYVALGLNILDSLQLTKGQHVAIFASTKLGLILAQLISYYKAVPILISDNANIIDIATNKLGVFYAFDSNQCDITRKIQVVTGGQMAAEVIYLLNSNYTLSDCVDVASSNATICLTGWSEHNSSIDTNSIVAKHLKLHGIYNGIGNYPSAINLIVTNKVIVDDMIGQHLNFDTLDEQLKNTKMEQGEIASLIIDVD